DDPAGGRPAGDVPPYPTVADDEQSVAVLDGATAVTASSSAADPFAAAYRGPDRRPAAAFDGDQDTAWVSDADPVGQWLELTLPGPVNLPAVTVSLVDDPAVGPAITRLRVSTDAGTLTVPVAANQDPQQVPVPPGATTRLRLTVASVAGAGGGAAGIREVAVPGVTVAEGLALPAATTGLERSGLPWTAVLARAAGRRGDCVRPDPAGRTRPWVCVAGLGAAGEEVTGLDRRFGTATAGPVGVQVTARARPGGVLDSLLDRALGYRATGSSTFSADPVARPGAAYDGDPATAWIPAGSDAMPQLRLDLGSTVRLRSLRLLGALADYAGVDRVVLAAGGQRRVLAATPGRDQFFAPLPARDLTVTLLRKAGKDGRLAPIRVADVVLGGAPPRAGGAVELPCGAGPSLGLDGAVVRTSVTTRVADLIGLGPVPARTCTGPVRLAAGQHRLVSAQATGQPVEVAGATLSGDRPLPAPGPARPVTVTAWAPESRRLQVAAGPAGYVALTEGFNPGWRATGNGQPLRPVRLDGWRQAWILPASTTPVRITVSYLPGRYQRAGLLAGLLAALLLALLAAPHPARRRAAAPAPARRSAARSGPLIRAVARLRRRPGARTAQPAPPAGSAGPSDPPAGPPGPSGPPAGPPGLSDPPDPPARPAARAGPSAGSSGPSVPADAVGTAARPGGPDQERTPGVDPSGMSGDAVDARAGAGRPVLATVLAVAVPLLLAGGAGLVPAVVAVILPARWRPAAAAGCLASAGLVLGLAPTAGAQPALTQLLSVTAVAVVAAALAGGAGSLLTSWRSPRPRR
ncbi:MAG: arabinofuranan 3-O-arabinosyltransferase, partial [Mycobacteriales bacterium]